MKKDEFLLISSRYFFKLQQVIMKSFLFNLIFLFSVVLFVYFMSIYIILLFLWLEIINNNIYIRIKINSSAMIFIVLFIISQTDIFSYTKKTETDEKFLRMSLISSSFSITKNSLLKVGVVILENEIESYRHIVKLKMY